VQISITDRLLHQLSHVFPYGEVAVNLNSLPCPTDRQSTATKNQLLYCKLTSNLHSSQNFPPLVPGNMTMTSRNRLAQLRSGKSPNNVLTFKVQELIGLQRDAMRAWNTVGVHCACRKGCTKPEYWLTWDRGVYFIHNGSTHVDVKGKIATLDQGPLSHSLRTVYCHEGNPHNNNLGWIEYRFAVFDGDDGGLTVRPKTFDDWLELHVTCNQIIAKARYSSGRLRLLRPLTKSVT
jgi:hypothetical protein